MRTTTKLYLLAAAITVASCGGEEEKNLGSRQPSAKMEVDYVVAKTEPIANTISASGTLLPGESSMVSAQVAGEVADISFDEGETVQKGEVLARLDDREWRARRKRLEAELENAKRDIDRKEQLLDIQGVSQAEVDEAKLQLATIEANREELDVLLDYATVRAPFTGKIGLRNVSPGSYLGAGDPIARLVQTDPLKLQFDIPEKYADMIKVGQAVNFTVAGKKETFQGKIYATEPAINEATRALRVRAKVPNGDGTLIPGAFAEVKLSLDSIPNAIMVPTEAVVPQLNEQIVYLIENGVAKAVGVNTGIRRPSLVQITEGIQDGDTVMISGLLQVREGMPVNAGVKKTTQEMEK